MQNETNTAMTTQDQQATDRAIQAVCKYIDRMGYTFKDRADFDARFPAIVLEYAEGMKKLQDNLFNEDNTGHLENSFQSVLRGLNARA
jgi:hypothetical protein